jgi:molecular chaperone DnaK (HSP70)
MSSIKQFLNSFSIELEASKPIRIIAIDLGTTNCVVTDCTWDPKDDEPKLEVLEIDQELISGGTITKQLIPSVVAVVNGKTYVGEGAKRFRTDVAAEEGKNIWWETKNYMGTRQLYAQAPEGFKTPKEIAAILLKFMLEAVIKHNPAQIDRFIVTVPASFQMPQREDTLAAAYLAGIELQPGDLLDEPIAAFLDHASRDPNLVNDSTIEKTLVIDFGGGTCDVAALDIGTNDKGEFEFSRRGVSRFHRIGGGDVDAAIAYEVLLPQLIRQNALSQNQFEFSELRQILSKLGPVAESLKVSISGQANLLMSANPNFVLEKELSAQFPNKVTVDYKDPKNAIHSYSFDAKLTWGELVNVVEQFVTSSPWLQANNEFYTPNTVFSPIIDCIHRSNWNEDQVAKILLVGGSSLFHFFKKEISQEFTGSQIFEALDIDQAQHAISRGAAVHGIFEALANRQILRPVVSLALQLKTATGLLDLIKDGTYLPFPESEDQVASYDGLTVPQLKINDRTIRFEIVSGGVSLTSSNVELDSSVMPGDQIFLDYSMDENQRLQILATITSSKGSNLYPLAFDNPFAVTANANAIVDQILQVEEELKTGKVSSEEDRLNKTLRLADLLASAENNLRAIQNYKRVYERTESRSVKIDILFKLSDLYARVKNYPEIERVWLAAIKLGSQPAIFNLALYYLENDEDKLQEALELAKQYSQAGGDTGNAMSAIISHKLGDTQNFKRFMNLAKEDFESGFELDRVDYYWFGRVASLAKDSKWSAQIAVEKSKLRESKPLEPDDSTGNLPNDNSENGGEPV